MRTFAVFSGIRQYAGFCPSPGTRVEIQHHGCFAGQRGTVLKARGLGRVQVRLDSGTETNFESRCLRLLDKPTRIEMATVTQTSQIVPLNIENLPVEAKSSLKNLPVKAKQLQVALNIDLAELTTEIAQYTEKQASLELASKQFIVSDDDSNAACLALRSDAARREKGLTDICKRYKDPLNAARKVVLDMEKVLVGPFIEIKDRLTKKSEAYILSQRRAKAAAEAQLSHVADQERQRLSREAEDLMAKGFVAEAIQKEQQASITVTPTLPDAVSKVEGSRIGDKFTGSVADIMAVLTAIVNKQTPLMWDYKNGEQRALVNIDQVLLNAIVSRMGKAAEKAIPGVVVTEGVRISSTKL